MKRFRLWMNCALCVLLALLLVTSGGDLFRAAAWPTTTTAAGAAASRATSPGRRQPMRVEIGRDEYAGRGEARPGREDFVRPRWWDGRVLDLETPGITQSSWAIEGNVRYANVVDNGYIEMWTPFPGRLGVLLAHARHLRPDGRAARQIGMAGVQACPSSRKPGKTPSKLEINVVLPSGGTVWLGPAKLKEVIAQLPSAAVTAIKKATGGVVAARVVGQRSAGWPDRRASSGPCSACSVRVIGMISLER